jgi:uncharacterized membrane protein YkvA (DUF1232 family)
MTRFLLTGIAAYGLRRVLRHREPYRSLFDLSGRQRISFIQRLLGRPDVPWLGKYLLSAYLAVPRNLIPNFIPVVGVLDDAALGATAVALLAQPSMRHRVEEILAEMAEG